MATTQKMAGAGNSTIVAQNIDSPIDVPTEKASDVEETFAIAQILVEMSRHTGNESKVEQKPRTRIRLRHNFSALRSPQIQLLPTPPLTPDPKRLRTQTRDSADDDKNASARPPKKRRLTIHHRLGGSRAFFNDRKAWIREFRARKENGARKPKKFKITYKGRPQVFVDQDTARNAAVDSVWS